MPSLDISTLVNWIVSGFIGLIFGIVSAWATHRYQRKRDDIAWEREKAKLQEQFEYDKRLLELQFQQRLKELEQQLSRQQSTHIRQEILKGVDSPDRTIEELQRARQRIYPQPPPSASYSGRYARRACVSWVPILVGAILAIIFILLILLPLLQR